MAGKFDIYDGEPWSEMDVRDLTVAMKHGSTLPPIYVGQGQLKKSAAKPKSLS